MSVLRGDTQIALSNLLCWFVGITTWLVFRRHVGSSRRHANCIEQFAVLVCRDYNVASFPTSCRSSRRHANCIELLGSVTVMSGVKAKAELSITKSPSGKSIQQSQK